MSRRLTVRVRPPMQRSAAAGIGAASTLLPARGQRDSAPESHYLESIAATQGRNQVDIRLSGEALHGGDVKMYGSADYVEFGRFRVTPEQALRMLAVLADGPSSEASMVAAQLGDRAQ
jgi:hypothetical protein